MIRYYILLLILFSVRGFSQTSPERFQQLKNEINQISPDLDLSDKLIFVCIWKSTDADSREINSEAYRVYKIYKNAKLKNGEKGTIFLSVNLDENSQNKEIALSRDGISTDVIYSNAKLIDLLRTEFNLENAQSTMLFDKTGAIQFTNMQKEQIFPSIRSLITR
jgi:hypothetical protein